MHVLKETIHGIVRKKIYEGYGYRITTRVIEGLDSIDFDIRPTRDPILQPDIKYENGNFVIHFSSLQEYELEDLPKLLSYLEDCKNLISELKKIL